MNKKLFRHLEINGGEVSEKDGWLLTLPPTKQGYADAQIDDYGITACPLEGTGAVLPHIRLPRRHLPYKPNTHLSLRARFSHPIGKLQGTAGFGFWNIPFADPSIKWPALPQATWFFYGSAPTDLPLSPSSKGQGWFASTLDATTLSAMSMIPIAPFVLLANQATLIRKKLWPKVQYRLGVDYAQIEQDVTQWHKYDLIWRTNGCQFIVDDKLVMDTKQSPQGKLGFVCWIDNQYMILTSRGKIGWGLLPTKESQWLQISNLEIGSCI